MLDVQAHTHMNRYIMDICRMHTSDTHSRDDIDHEAICIHIVSWTVSHVRESQFQNCHYSK